MADEQPTLESRRHSIVLVGSFNPAIFQPFWFSSNGLIRKEEAEAATVDLIHSQATIFSTPWFLLKADQSRFSVETADPGMVMPLRDLALFTFQILEHTPLKYFGFNTHDLFRMPSEEAWHQVGHTLAPKAAWDGIVENPGMRLLIIQGKRKNCDAEYVQTRVEPSPKVKTGLYIATNQHYDFDSIKDEAQSITERLAIRLNGDWENFLSYSEGVSRHLFANC